MAILRIFMILTKRSFCRKERKMVPSLQGRVCLVTGACRGIGKGIALQLGAAGATVYITGSPTVPYQLIHYTYGTGTGTCLIGTLR